MILYVRKCSVPWGKSRLWELRHAGTDLREWGKDSDDDRHKTSLQGRLSCGQHKIWGMGRNCFRGHREQKLWGLITFDPFVRGGGGGGKALRMPRAQRMRKGRSMGSSRRQVWLKSWPLRWEPMELSTWDLLEVTYVIKGRSDCSKKTDLPEASIKMESPVQVLGTSQSPKPGQR